MLSTVAAKDPPSLLSMVLEAAKDTMIIILLVVAIITIVLGAAVPEQRAHNAWSEGLAVLGTALIVIFICESAICARPRAFGTIPSHCAPQTLAQMSYIIP
jgi:P-type Ca2+ transporter type 2C